MSESSSIDKLSESLTLGTPLSSRLGVDCYPAIGADGKRYILKTITAPAAQAQLDALLLAGAYPDSGSALEYFRQQAESVCNEAELLGRLSKLEGFLAYSECTLSTPGEDRLGYQVKLVSPFRRSLERYIRGNTVTHLEVVNLGLDLCAALACARRAGYLYVDLKPANIFISENKEYKIGDLGFVPLDSLNFASLPEKYISPYTAPELCDPLEVVNETADTYAVGMILYRLLNGGKLPPKGRSPQEPLNPPLNANGEIWEIISKACAVNPADRWESPTAMGQALVAYMQRNTINNVPLTEPVVNRQTGKIPTLTSVIPTPAEKPEAEESTGSAEVGGETMVFTAVAKPEEAPAADSPSSPEEAPVQDAEPSEESENAVQQEPPAVPAEEAAQAEAPEEIPAPAEKAENSGEINDHPRDFFHLRQFKAASAPVMEEKPVKRKRRWIPVVVTLLVLLILGGLTAGGLWYYRTLYVQNVDGIRVEGTRDGLEVTVSAGFDTSGLIVSCIDPYGNALTKGLTNGKAVFEDLHAGTLYNIYLHTGSNHKLTGETYTIFTTDHEANVISLSAITGAEDGSMIVSLNVDGREPETWLAVCSAEGVEDTSVSFSGHSVTIRGLTVGKDYILTLSAEDGSPISGKTQLEFMVYGLVVAEDLVLEPGPDDTLTVTWAAPSKPVSGWDVRCYTDDYDETVNVVETKAVFTGINSAKSYTVEVTAEGMTQSSRATITANPIHITNFKAVTENNTINLSWNSTGAVPQGGWLVMYTIDGSATPAVVKTEENSTGIKLMVPGGRYDFTIQAADGTSIFDNTYSHQTAQKPFYALHSIDAHKVTLRTLVTPAEEGWLADDIPEDQFTSTFRKGEKISLVLDSAGNFYLQPGEFTIRYVFRDENGGVLLNLISEVKSEWESLWYAAKYQLAELDLQTAPATPGNYTLDVFFDGLPFGSCSFTITE